MTTVPLFHRRHALRQIACGFGATAAAAMLGEDSIAAGVDPMAPRASHFAPRVKRVIFLFLHGGMSHVISRN